jgi:hypothetical protein
MIHWSFCSGGVDYFTSAPVYVFDSMGEKCKLVFEVSKYIDDGYNVDRWKIACYLTDEKWIGDLIESQVESHWILGKNYRNSIYAKEYCEYVVESFKKHQSFRCLPIAEIHRAF